jgi:hypothetical protein
MRFLLRVVGGCRNASTAAMVMQSRASSPRCTPYGSNSTSTFGSSARCSCDVLRALVATTAAGPNAAHRGGPERRPPRRDLHSGLPAGCDR